MEDLFQFDELVAVAKSIANFQHFCVCILPNYPEIKYGPNNQKFIDHLCNHSSKYHFSPNSSLSTGTNLLSHVVSPKVHNQNILLVQNWEKNS